MHSFWKIGRMFPFPFAFMCHIFGIYFVSVCLPFHESCFRNYKAITECDPSLCTKMLFPNSIINSAFCGRLIWCKTFEFHHHDDDDDKYYKQKWQKTFYFNYENIFVACKNFMLSLQLKLYIRLLIVLCCKANEHSFAFGDYNMGRYRGGNSNAFWLVLTAERIGEYE